MTTTLKDFAIQKALENNWTEAISANLEIVNANNNDLDALNRLAYAYLKSGQFKQAKETYDTVLSMDKTNPIAIKNLRKISTLAGQKASAANSIPSGHIMENVFIQEAGKTKTVELINLADKKTLLTLQNGDEVHLAMKRSKVFVLSPDKTYIGMLPDSIGIRLISFIKGGNEYQACVKGIDDKSVSVFIKEVKRAKKFSNQSSFS